MIMRVKKVRDHRWPLPSYATKGSSGFDFIAHIHDDTLPEPNVVCLYPGERVLIPTGIAVEVPEGFELQVRPRSGLALKKGITVLNTPGTIDSDFRNEIGVILINHGQECEFITAGERIAQGVVTPVVQVEFVETEQLDETSRGGGFGSTDAN